MVSVDEPPPGAAIAVGLNVAVAPAGNPDADKETAELKVPDRFVVIVDDPELPRAIVKLFGDDATEKSLVVPPEVNTFNAKSSTTKEVFNAESSVPTK